MKPSDMELEEDPQHLVDILSRVMAPFSLSCYLFVFFSSSSSFSATILPAPVMLGCVGPCLTVCARNWRGGTDVQTKLLTSVRWGQINYVNVCVATGTSAMSCFCTVVVIVEGFFHPPLIHQYPFNPLRRNTVMSDKQHSWAEAKVQQAQLACSKIKDLK